MGSINLIAARRAERLRLMRVTRALTFSCLGAAACLVAVFTINSARLIHSNLMISRAEAELKRLEPTLARIREAQAERLALRPKLTTLTNAQGATQRWYGVLDGLKRSIPPQAWLTSLVVEGAKEGEQAIRFNGVTVNQEKVGETMLRLNQLNQYQDINLHFTQASKLGDRDTVQFEFAALLKPMEGQRDEVAQAKAQ
jgi:Tfp pilus assembly protein PilN